jgi:hypothetical protein
MKEIRNFLSRFRLLSSLLALAVLLGALWITPVRAATICEDGCWNWNSVQGCVNCQHCCSYDDGHYTCIGHSDTDCNTGGPWLFME